MRWLITETVEYIVEASSAEEAEAIFLDDGPHLAEASPVIQGDVTDRRVEDAR